MGKFVWYNAAGEDPVKVAELVIDGNKHTWTMKNENIRKEIEEFEHPTLVINKVSKDGIFDYTDEKHTSLLPILYRSPYLYCVSKK